MTYISVGDDTVISDTPLRRPSDRGWIMRGGNASNKTTIMAHYFLIGPIIRTMTWAPLHIMYVEKSLVWGLDQLEPKQTKVKQVNLNDKIESMKNLERKMYRLNLDGIHP